MSGLTHYFLEFNLVVEIKPAAFIIILIFSHIKNPFLCMSLSIPSQRNNQRAVIHIREGTNEHNTPIILGVNINPVSR